MSLDPACLEPSHFLWDFANGVATITLNRPERKNPLTFDSYAELRDTFNALGAMPRVRAVDEAAVTRAASQHIDPSRLLTVIVGDRDAIEPGLRALGLPAPELRDADGNVI